MIEIFIEIWYDNIYTYIHTVGKCGEYSLGVGGDDPWTRRHVHSRGQKEAGTSYS